MGVTSCCGDHCRGRWLGPEWACANSASADSARGAVLYAENCASCHGANLEGQQDWQTPDPDGVLRAPA
ncbi:c-type cytochrome [Ruegeria sp. SCSIO 43209]|uniref:c-type cytochrome n=1 Tax=Ruegeria sp. SCSIO 43209 TaxID=2793010 RepID=UPI00351D8EC5